MRELGLRRVDAADEDVEHEVHALDVGEAVAVGLGGQQRRDEVLAGVVAAGGEQRVGVVVELDHGLLDELALGHERLGVELLLDPVGPVVQPRRVGQRGAHHRRDDQRRVGLGEGLDELAAPVGAHGLPELLEVGAHGRAPAVGGARREGRVDEVAQAPVVVAVDAEDVAAQLLGQRAGLDPEQLGQLAARGRSSSGCAGRPRSPRGRAPSRRSAWPPASPGRAARPCADGSPGRAGPGRCSRGPAGRARTSSAMAANLPRGLVRRCGRRAYGGHGPRRPRTAARQPPVPRARC